MIKDKFVRTRKYLLIAFAAVFSLAMVIAIPFTQQSPMVADALVATNTVLPDDVQSIFKDYTLTSVSDEYNTLDALDEYRKTLGDNANVYKDYLTRAEQIIYGNVRFNGMREFSTDDDALNHIDQYGDLEYFQNYTLKWAFAGNVSQVTGIYGISNETFTVYVDAEVGVNLPSLVLAQSKGDGHNGIGWRNTVTLKRGINTFDFPFSTSTGDKSGVVYINNPYTPDSQHGKVSLYIEGGGFYPVYRVGDDEEVFIEQVKEFVDVQRQKNSKIPDIAELLPDYALLTITATSVYEAYVINKVSPAENLELWSNYFTKTFEFHGMSSDDEDHPVQPYVRINIRRMAVMPNAGAYTYFYHIGVYSGEDKWFADYRNDSLNEYARFAHVGHEIGHTLDTNGRTVVETTNNMNAVYAYFRILGKSMSSGYLPFYKAQDHIFSDYTLDDRGYDEGRVLYTMGTYDHNYMMWWCLESVFPGYWAELNNYYRYDSSANSMTYSERMVYYSSLVTKVDLSDYFERWGWYYGRTMTASAMFKKDTATQAFRTAMDDAKKAGKINNVYDHYWYADVKQMDFTLTHLSATEDERAYVGDRPVINSIKIAGTQRVLEIGGKADDNLLGYEIYSNVGNDGYKIAGFTYSDKFTDTYTYNIEPTYKVRAVNRYFELSDESQELQGPTEESTDDEYVCKIGDTYYDNLKTAFQNVKTGGTISLLADCSASGIDFTYKGELIIKVDDNVHKNITITHSGVTSIFSTSNSNANLTLQGREDAKIVIDGENKTYALPAIYSHVGKVHAEYVVFRNYSSNSTSISGGAIYSNSATLELKNCSFENCSSNTSFGVISAGSNTNVFENCEFVNCSGINSDRYLAAIGFTTTGSGNIVLDSCAFKENETADIYVNGNYTFKNHIPTIVVDFDKNNRTIALEDCNDLDAVGNITLKNASHSPSLKDNNIEFVESQYQLTFKFDDGQTKTYTLKGTSEFKFGTENITLGDNKYIHSYLDDAQHVYKVGDKITVDKDVTFTLEIRNYLVLTLKYQGNNGVKEKEMQLKHDGKFYLPRYDDNGKEIVKWVFGNTTYWAGEEYLAKEDDTLFAIYPGSFNYVIVCRDQVLEYGYLSYNSQINLDALSVDWDDLLCWRIGSQSIAPHGQYTVTSDVVLVALFSDEGETIYNLSDCEIEFDADGYVYDGQAKRPSVTVTIGGEPVPEEYYKVTYRNNVNAGVATITVEPQGYRAYGSKIATFDIYTVAYSKDAFDIDNMLPEIVYSGSQTIQTPVIRWNGLTLVADKDYTVEYSGNCVNVGTVNVTITFQGNFTGEAHFSYQIVRANRDSFNVTIESWMYGNTAKSPSISGYEELGSVFYTYATSSEGEYVEDKPQDAGEYWVKAVIAQTDNYNEAVAYAKFTIFKATLTSIPQNFTVDSRNTSLQDVANRLPQGWSWFDETMPLVLGSNTAEAVYEDEKNYTNSRIVVTITVTEFAVDIGQAQIIVLEKCVYNGLAQQPAVKVELNGETLKENVDYTLAYSDNINACTATITVTGTGKYSGTKVVEFAIDKQDISDRIELSMSNAELVNGIYKILYNGQSHTIYGTVRGLEDITVVVNINSVTNVGEYVVKAEISADNYCGEKEFTVSVYAQTVEPDESTKPDTPGKDNLPDDSTPKDNKPKDTNAVAIAIGVVSLVVAVGAIGGVIYWIILRRRKR